MKSILTIGLLALMLWMPTEKNAQTIELEKTYALDGKAKRGVLKHVKNMDNGDCELYYVTKSNNKKVKFLIYTFNKDFDFQSKREEELEFEKVKGKYSWFPFKGDEYSVEGISLNWNPIMPLKLKKKRTIYKYDWLLLGYYKTVEVLEKVKPKTDDGLKYFAKGYFEDEITGDLYIIAGVAPGAMSKDAGAQLMDMRLLKFDWNLNKVAETKIPFEFGQEVIFTKGFAKPDPENEAAVGFDGGVIVFAPTVWKGSSAKVDKNKGNFTYVEFDKDLTIIGRESFDNPSPGWTIDGMSWSANNTGGRDVYLYGAAAFGKDKYYAVAAQSAKKKSIQLLKSSNGKIQYFTESTIENIASVKQIPSTQKKTFDYNGKSKLNMNFQPLNNGNIVLYGQYYNKDGHPEDYSALEFDTNGNLVTNYMRNMMLPIKAKFTVGHSIIENNNGAFWVAYEATGDASVQNIVPVITKVDVNSKKMGNPLVLGTAGGKKPIYFVDKAFPMLGITETEQVYFGSDKKGKNIWFCKVKL